MQQEAQVESCAQLRICRLVVLIVYRRVNMTLATQELNCISETHAQSRNLLKHSCTN